MGVAATRAGWRSLACVLTGNEKRHRPGWRRPLILGGYAVAVKKPAAKKAAATKTTATKAAAKKAPAKKAAAKKAVTSE